MGFNEDDSYVRVDFFKASGKWYTTEAVKWTGAYLASDPVGNQTKTQSIHDAFAQSLRDHFKDRPGRLSDMDAVCLEPYHEHSHPIQIKYGGWVE